MASLTICQFLLQQAHWVSKLKIEQLQLAHKYYVTTNKCIVNYVINIQQQVLTGNGVFKTN